jgi:hypothetical protein
MKDIRSAINAALKVNSPLVEGLRDVRMTLTTEETTLVEALRSHPAFEAIDKDQLDRHTLKHIFVQISDKPVSVCERTAAKVERMVEAGLLDASLAVRKALTEAEVPEERPASKDGDGEMKQGPADSTAGEHDGEDVGKAAKPAPKGDADQGASQDKDTQGDKADLDKEGYMKEDEEELPDEEDELPEDADGAADAKDDRDPQMDETEDSDPAQAGKPAQDLPEEEDEDDDEELDEEDPPPAAPPMPAPKAEKCKKESEDEEDDDEEELPEAEDGEKDAKDPANDDASRAANDATYKDGKGQNEAKKGLKEDDLDQPNQTKDASDLPDLDKVQKEDPSNSELNKGPAAVELESLAGIEKRIHSILREAGIKKGSKRWTEAYLRGWQLAMEHRARRIAESCKRS